MDVEMVLHTFPNLRLKKQTYGYGPDLGSHLIDVSCHFCMKDLTFGSSAVFSPRTFAQNIGDIIIAIYTYNDITI